MSIIKPIQSPVGHRGTIFRTGLCSPRVANQIGYKNSFELQLCKAISTGNMTQFELEDVDSTGVEVVEEELATVQQNSDLAYLKNLETMSAEIEEKQELIHPAKPKDNSAQLQIIDACRGDLQQYKKVRALVKPWMESFTKNNGRQPTLSDLNEVEEPQLRSDFKSYLLLKDKLFTELPQLRQKLDTANLNNGPVTQLGGLGNVINCNAQQNENQGRASRFLSALEYKAQQRKNKSTSDKSQLDKQDSLDRMSKLLPAASPRVRKAMMAAMEYKKNKTSNKQSQNVQQQ
eukprot:TRINITY_DN1621_c0_g1_i1.p1 TRINITY_DN1621_c0_g1~~TRINITY_DN1621_c0_g1_i1.p1  ORF type:complete len:289 (-),score=47.45 TRINITY_DN1621_c0_g1_i1:481-1347(-)